MDCMSEPNHVHLKRFHKDRDGSYITLRFMVIQLHGQLSPVELLLCLNVRPYCGNRPGFQWRFDIMDGIYRGSIPYSCSVWNNARLAGEVGRDYREMSCEQWHINK